MTTDCIWKEPEVKRQTFKEGKVSGTFLKVKRMKY